MAESATQEKKPGSGRKFTPRKPLAAKDEKRLAAVDAAFETAKEDQKIWARRYGTKVLKHAAGLRATPAPIPPELGEKNAAKVREVLGIVDAPKEAKTNSKAKATAKTTSTRKRSTAKKAEPKTEEAPAEPLAGEPA
jgi:hypothetical protein